VADWNPKCEQTKLGFVRGTRFIRLLTSITISRAHRVSTAWMLLRGFVRIEGIHLSTVFNHDIISTYGFNWLGISTWIRLSPGKFGRDQDTSEIYVRGLKWAEIRGKESWGSRIQIEFYACNLPFQKVKLLTTCDLILQRAVPYCNWPCVTWGILRIRIWHCRTL
jgi:hypothetical protein